MPEIYVRTWSDLGPKRKPGAEAAAVATNAYRSVERAVARRARLKATWDRELYLLRKQKERDRASQ